MLMAVKQLATLPILLRTWGPEYYGNWLVLSSLPSFIAMSNLGLGSSAAARIALRPPDSHAENGKTYFTSMSVIICVMFFIQIVIILWSGLHHGANFGLEDGASCLILLVGSAFLRIASQPLQGWWNARGQAEKGIHSNQLFNLGELIIYLLVPLFGGKALMLTFSALVWTIIWLVSYIYYLRCNGCSLFTEGRFDRSELKDLLSKGVAYQLSPVWQGLVFQGTIILAKQLFGPSGAALWGALRVVNRAGNQILELISQTCGPEFQRNFAIKAFDSNKRLHSAAILLSVIISIIIAGLMMFFGPTLFSWWTNKQFNEPYAVWVILPLSLIPFSLWWISGEYQRSLNEPWYLNIVGCLAASLSIIVTIQTKDLGIVSLCLGSLAFEILMLSMILPRSLKLLSESWSDFSKSIGSIVKSSCRMILLRSHAGNPILWARK
jgi:O-antigen/teichoic acid export membrane protein